MTKNTKREKCAAAGRDLRKLQADHLREVARGLKNALEGLRAALSEHKLRDLKYYSLLCADAQAGTAIEAARRLGL